MKNLDKVFRFIENKRPHKLTNADIVKGTGIRPHQQVFQLTQKLLKASRIHGHLIENEWRFWSADVESSNNHDSNSMQMKTAPIPKADKSSAMTPAQFETLAADALGRYFESTLDKRAVPGINKTFDLVSPDQKVVGDAKYYTMVRGHDLPSAKFSVIAEYVWLLEHTDANCKFLVFGNDRRVPDLWLDRYGSLVNSVEFYFLENDGSLHKLNSI